jgi:putative endonuclease
VGPLINRIIKLVRFLVMNICYIIYSPSFEERILKHNAKQYGQKYTSFTNDWKLFISIECSTVTQAMAVEKHIKKMKSRVYIQNLKTYPGIIEKLLQKY